MALFKIKKNEPEPFSAPGAMPPPPGSSGLIEQINMLRQQGYQDEQIVQYLQGQGNNPAEIYDALNQIDMGAAAAQPMQPQMPPPMAPSPMDQGMPPPPMEQPMHASQEASREKIEEVAEAIINEKWNDILKEINKIVEWKEGTESKIARIEQEIKNIKENFDALHKGMLGKITEYDQNIARVGTSIQAMDMTFKKILPTLTENVNRLAGVKSAQDTARPSIIKKK